MTKFPHAPFRSSRHSKQSIIIIEDTKIHVDKFTQISESTMTTITMDFTQSTVVVTIPAITTSHNLGPLPSTSFPSNCLSDWWNFQTEAYGLNTVWSYHTQGCATSTCCPSDIFYTERYAFLSSYYSPGVCPDQYRSCAPPGGATALSSKADETIAMCCPTSESKRFGRGNMKAHLIIV
jgi:hypothetical protein